MLVIKDLYAKAKDDKEIIKGLNLEIKKGEVHVIMGPNGSGKTTLSNVILNNPKYEITGGEIYFENELINNLKTDEIAKKGIFMSFQSPVEVEGVKVSEFLKLSKNSLDNTKFI